jgi:hypothetical protein
MRRVLPICLVTAAACGQGGTTTLATPRIDTLPGGTVEVKNDGPTAWIDTTGWRFVEVRRFNGDSSGPGELTRPMGFAIDGAGNTYVIQDGPARISKFGPDGAFVGQIGREGSGPGEFESGMLAVFHDTLIVQDPRTSRVTLFDTAGRFVRTFHSACCYFGGGFQVDTAGRIYVSTQPRHPGSDDVAFLRFTLSGGLVDTVELHSPGTARFWEFAQAGGRTRFMIRYTPSFVGRPDGWGGAFSGWTADYRIAVLSNWKDTSLVFSLKAAPVPVPAALRDSAVAVVVKGMPQMASVAKLSDVPEYAPAFGQVQRDAAGNIWVATGVSRTPTSRFDVFDRSGRYLGAVPRPAQMSYEWEFGRDLMTALVERDDGGYAIVTYRIDRRGR